MMRPPLSALALAIVAPLTSCGDRGERSEGGPAVSAPAESPLRYDSLRLSEDEDIYIGEPFSLLVVPGAEPRRWPREVWVSDFFSNSLLRFDGEGAFWQRIGRAGPGPHEFSAVTLLFLTEPNEVGAVDLRRREIKWFDRDSGEYRRLVRYETGSMGRSPPVRIGDGRPPLVFPLLDRTARTSLGILEVASQTWTRAGPFPEPYRRSLEDGSGRFTALFPDVLLDRLDERAVLVGFAGVDTLYRFDLRRRSAVPLGKVPRVLRRGIEGDCRFAYESSPLDTSKCAPPFEQFSVMMGIWVLRDGRLAVLHADNHLEGTPPVVEVTSRGYLSVLDRDGGAACVDLLVPGGDDSGAFSDVEGDVLYTLDRRLTDLSTETWLLRMPIPSLAACPAAHRVARWGAAPTP